MTFEMPFLFSLEKIPVFTSVEFGRVAGLNSRPWTICVDHTLPTSVDHRPMDRLWLIVGDCHLPSRLCSPAW